MTAAKPHTTRQPAMAEADKPEPAETDPVTEADAPAAETGEDEPTAEPNRFAEYGDLSGQALWDEISAAAIPAGTTDLAPWDGFQAAKADCHPVLVHVETGESYPCTEAVVARVLDNWYRLADMRIYAGSRAVRSAA